MKAGFCFGHVLDNSRWIAGKEFFVFLLFTSTFLPAHGQSSSPAGDFLRDFAADQKRIWTAPFHMTRQQALAIALPLAAGTVALKSSDRAIVDGLPDTPAQRDWSRRVSLIGSMAGLAMATGGTIAYGHFAGRPSWTHIGRDAGLALSSALTVTYALKGVTWRERPDVPGSRGSFYSGGDSFPSGHAVTSFAVATAVATHPGVPKWLKVTLFATATAISVSRVTGRRHWPSDVYFGAFSGILIGRSVARAPHVR
ncbi:MAG: phosphatase PAP2 family protein [Bryobacteraceae bacterium]